jgi:hypothetical protein
VQSHLPMPISIARTRIARTASLVLFSSLAGCISEEPSRASAPLSIGGLERDSGADFDAGFDSDADEGDSGDVGPRTFTQISAGWNATCGVTTSQGIVCWGAIPEDVPAGPYMRVSTNAQRAGGACAIRIDGSLVCWNVEGEATVPAGKFTDVKLRDQYACALDVHGQARCWYIDGSTTDLTGLLTPPAETFLAMSAGGFRAIGVLGNGSLTGWGAHTSNLPEPSGIYTVVGSGYAHHCALGFDKNVTCWGTVSDGQDADLSGPFEQLSVGEFHNCALAADGAATCWGAGESGQIDVPDGSWARISAGGHHTCGLRMDGTAECWGSNEVGEATVPD